MPSPRSGKAGTPVPPTEPKAAIEADNADPGSADQIAANQRKNHEGKTKPHKPDHNKKSWIEIGLVDEENQPVPGERYEITLADGEHVAGGALDERGFARVDGIEPGTCQVTFPELDGAAWERA